MGEEEKKTPPTQPRDSATPNLTLSTNSKIREGYETYLGFKISVGMEEKQEKESQKKEEK